jgi:hypothetical protein
MGATVEHRLKATLAGTIEQLPLEVGKHNRLVIERPTVRRPREPYFVAPNSAMFVPGPWAPDQHPIPFALAAVHQAAVMASPIVFVVGHVGGGESKSLGQARADCVRCLLESDRDGWVTLATERGSIRDVKGYLEYLNEIMDWPCFVDEVDPSTGPSTREAVLAFQGEFNQQFDGQITEDGICGKQTLGALFDVMRLEWDKWLYKHDVDPSRIDGLDIRYVDGASVDASTPAAEPLDGRPCVDLLVMEAADLEGEDPAPELIYGSAVALWEAFEVPLEPWGWAKGPYTIVSDLPSGEVVPKEVYTLRATDGSIEVSQILPDDAVDNGLLELRFFALPVDRTYELTVKVHDQEPIVLFSGVPYNTLHHLATKGPDDEQVV